MLPLAINSAKYSCQRMLVWISNAHVMLSLCLAIALQVQEAVLNSGSSHAPHVVAPIRSSSSSAMAIQYLQDLAHRLSNRPSRRQREATASAGEYAGRVVQPEFLVFRDVTSAVLAQVRSTSLCTHYVAASSLGAVTCT